MNQTDFSILSLSPLDGRYKWDVADVSSLFSEMHLFRTRLFVEIEWLKMLARESNIEEIKKFDTHELNFLQNLIEKFDMDTATQIKTIEKKINHDVKAVEYFLKKKLTVNDSLKRYQEFVHFGCTSDDINNLCYALILADTRKKVLMPNMKKIIERLKNTATNYAETPMLARTHGQAATPTTLGKEMNVFAYRLNRQLQLLSHTEILGKFNGATGNFSAHSIAYPEIDWQNLCSNFVTSLGIAWNPCTTQIEPHDWISEYCDCLSRFNTILIGFCRDMWGYISLGYFKQVPKKIEVGSSAMPHKINPIDFENAEGNLGIANALLDHLSNKLPISRWQRDLTDSTVMRNIGVAIGHSYLAYKSITSGLDRLEVDQVKIGTDLDSHWEVLAEAIQTVMRRHGVETPYEKLKELTRGQNLDKKTLHEFIKNLEIQESTKKHLLALTPAKYIGKAPEIARINLEKTGSPY